MFSNSNLGKSSLFIAGFLTILLIPFELVFDFFALSKFRVDQLSDLCKNIVVILYALFFIRKYNYLAFNGLKNFIPQQPSILLIPTYILIVAPIQYVVMDYQFHGVNTTDVLIILLTTLSVGISEEIVFRGFVLPHLIVGSPSDRSLLEPIVLSALLFGVLHLLNLFQPDKHVSLVFSQLVYATLFGIGFAVILLITRSLLSVGIIHGLINFTGSLDKLPGAVRPASYESFVTWEAIISILVVLPFFLIMIKEAQKCSRQEVMSLFKYKE